MTKTLLAGAAVAALAVAGCGSSSSTTPTTTPATGAAPATTTTSASTTPTKSASASTISIAADPGGMLMFNTKSLKAKAGTVVIDFTNKSSLPHNLTLATAGGAVVGSTPTFSGGTKTLTVSLKPGTYRYFCSVPGHAQGGMSGTLVVS